jgi:hypothetical protein
MIKNYEQICALRKELGELKQKCECCDGTGKSNSECCGEPVTESELCTGCGEHSPLTKCDCCEGTGETEFDLEQRRIENCEDYLEALED